MKQNETNLSQKNPNYFCEFCEYTTNNKKDFKKHLMTAKHQNETNETKMKQLCPEKSQKSQNLQCQCGLILNSRTTLWRHRKKCTKISTTSENINEIADKDLIMMLVKQNTELLEVIKNGTNNTNISYNNSNNNSNNKTFNLNFFLNETCKDAMNIMDFVDFDKTSIKRFRECWKIGFCRRHLKYHNNKFKSIRCDTKTCSLH
jgi:hypothetical protein